LLLRKLIVCAAALAGASAVAVFALAPGSAPAGERTAAAAAAEKKDRKSRRLAVLLQPGDGYLLEEIKRHRNETWRWQRVMQRSLTRHSAAVERSRSRAYREWVHRLWAERARKARIQATHPPHRAAWLCIHRLEGAWNDPNAPYWGGLQMGVAFMEAFGARLLRLRGTADRWTPLEQMWAAERAYKVMGFHPWPHTARACGLL
jgi:hypothetical protein